MKAKHSILKSLSQNFEVLTPWVDDINPKNGWKRSSLVFHVPRLVRRWESKVKGTFRWIFPLWKRSLKIMKFWLNVVTSSISCKNGDRKIKMENKRNFEVRYSFMKLFSGNLKIIVLCCDVIISKSGQKDSSVCIMYNWL